jgi:hypothetical protein
VTARLTSAAAVAAILVAGCGSSVHSSTSKAAYLDRADARCAHYQGGIVSLVETMRASARSSRAAFVRRRTFFTEAIASIRDEADAIEQIRRPQDDTGDLALMFTSLQSALTDLSNATPAVARGDVSAFTAVAARVLSIAAEGRQLGAAYGFSRCLRMFD